MIRETHTHLPETIARNTVDSARFDLPEIKEERIINAYIWYAGRASVIFNFGITLCKINDYTNYRTMNDSLRYAKYPFC